MRLLKDIPRTESAWFCLLSLWYRNHPRFGRQKGEPGAKVHLGAHRPALLEVFGVRPHPLHLLQNLRRGAKIDKGGQGHEALACGAQDSPS